MSVYSGTLTPRSVHPASPVLLTKNGLDYFLNILIIIIILLIINIEIQITELLKLKIEIEIELNVNSVIIFTILL